MSKKQTQEEDTTSIEEAIKTLFGSIKGFTSFLTEHEGDLEGLIVAGGKAFVLKLLQAMPDEQKQSLIKQLLEIHENKIESRKKVDKKINDFLELLGYKTAEKTKKEENTQSTGKPAHYVLISRLIALCSKNIDTEDPWYKSAYGLSIILICDILMDMHIPNFKEINNDLKKLSHIIKIKKLKGESTVKLELVRDKLLQIYQASK